MAQLKREHFISLRLLRQRQEGANRSDKNSFSLARDAPASPTASLLFSLISQRSLSRSSSLLLKSSQRAKRSEEAVSPTCSFSDAAGVDVDDASVGPSERSCRRRGSRSNASDSCFSSYCRRANTDLWDQRGKDKNEAEMLRSLSGDDLKKKKKNTRPWHAPKKTHQPDPPADLRLPCLFHPLDELVGGSGRKQ